MPVLASLRTSDRDGEDCSLARCPELNGFVEQTLPWCLSLTLKPSPLMLIMVEPRWMRRSIATGQQTVAARTATMLPKVRVRQTVEPTREVEMIGLERGRPKKPSAPSTMLSQVRLMTSLDHVASPRLPSTVRAVSVSPVDSEQT